MYLLNASLLSTAFDAEPALQGYVVYGDKGYRTRGCVLAPFRGINLAPHEARHNEEMGRVRVAVEWYFGIVVSQWQACAFRQQQKIWLSAIQEQFRVAILLTNARTCMRGSKEISLHFGVAPPSLLDYLGAQPG
jgi:hypothetical protein